MKYALWIGLFAAGLAVGYLIGLEKSTLQDGPQVSTTEFIKEMVHDTIIQTETVEIPVEEEVIDSNIAEVDTLLP